MNIIGVATDTSKEKLQLALSHASFTVASSTVASQIDNALSPTMVNEKQLFAVYSANQTAAPIFRLSSTVGP